MLVSKSIEVRNNFKGYCEKVLEGETLVISRKNNANVVMISEADYNSLQREKDQLKMRVKVLAAEAGRLAGEPTYSAEEVFQELVNEYA